MRRLALLAWTVMGCGDAPPEPPVGPVVPGTIVAFAGNGTAGLGTLGGPATATMLAFPSGVALDDEGRVLVGDFKNHRVLRVEDDGTLALVAGNGTRGLSGDGGPATAAALSFPCGVEADGQGGVLISDSNNHRVRRVGPDGAIGTVVDGLKFPEGLASDGHGGFWVAEAGRYRVSRWTPEAGLVLTLGEGLQSPYDVALSPDGRVLVADYGGDRILAIASDGAVSVVAGTGQRGFSGDGGPATAARLHGPQGVRVGSDLAIWIADTGNHRVRRVGTDGVITTVAGTGTPGNTGDGGSALAAELSGPAQVVLDPSGTLFIADTENNRIRAVPGATTPGPFPGDYDVVEGTGVFDGAELTAGPDGAAGPNGIVYAFSGTVTFAAGGAYVADLRILVDGRPHWLTEASFTRFEGPWTLAGDRLTLAVPLWDVTKVFTWAWDAAAEELTLVDATPRGAVPLIHGDVTGLVLRKAVSK